MKANKSKSISKASKPGSLKKNKKEILLKEEPNLGKKNNNKNTLSSINQDKIKNNNKETNKKSLFIKRENSVHKKLQEKKKNNQKLESKNIKDTKKIRDKIKSSNIDNISNLKSIKKDNSRIKNNKVTEIEKTKENSQSKRLKEFRVQVDKFLSTASKSKETISTYQETISTEENQKKENEKERESSNITQKNIIKEVNENKSSNQRNNTKKKTLKNTESQTEKIELPKLNDNNLSKGLTPIPTLQKKKDGETLDPNSKDVQNAIMLRRLEYNDYIKNLNKPKKPKPKPKPKPKIYDNNKVNEIQKVYRGFQTRIVNQTINRLKVNLCVTELTCLILREVLIHSRRRIPFYLLKLYYHDPFVNIGNEVDFNDKLNTKLSDKYYNFNNFKEGKTQRRLHI
jgi:hypothetical protein